MKKITIAALLLGTTLICSCNTVAGFGDDLRHLGGSMSNKAEKAK
jgi:entericidin A